MYVVVFNSWENGLTHSQPVAAGSDLGKVQEFIEGLSKRSEVGRNDLY